MFLSCNEKSKNQIILDNVYSLMLLSDYDLAVTYANNHNDEFVVPLSEEDKAYLTLINSMYWLYILNYYAIDDTIKINQCIETYSNTNDKEKLAWALLLKSGKMYENEELWNDGIYYLKQSEHIANKLNCTELNYQIASLKLNYDGHSMNMQYKMTLVDSMGKYAQNKIQKAFYYETKSIAFSTMLDGIDSAKFYLRKASEYDTVSYWYSVSYILSNIDGDIEKTQKHVDNVLSMSQQSAEATYVQVHLFIKSGLIDKAEEFFATHSPANDFYKIRCNNDFANYYAAKGDYKKSNEFYKDNNKLYNKTYNIISENKVAYNSQQYDFDINNLEQQHRSRRTIVVVILIASFTILLLLILLLYQKRRQEKLQNEKKQILKESQERIVALKAADKTDDNIREINRLQNKITEIENRYADIYREGRKLYDDIFSGNANASQWKKNDYEKFIAYYKTIDLSLIAQIEEEYSGLNPRQLFFKILQAKNFEKERIMNTLGIFTDGAFRALKSKVEAKKKN